jgi:hypothetical protein
MRGQLWRAVYLCDYSAQPEFRRTINRLLLRGESVHQLQRAIHYGPIRAHRGRRRDEFSLMSGALTLLTNSVIAYNTWKLKKLRKLNEVIEARRRADRVPPPDDILAHIAPIAFGHINFRGCIASRSSATWIAWSRRCRDAGTLESGGRVTALSTGNRYLWPECVTTPKLYQITPNVSGDEDGKTWWIPPELAAPRSNRKFPSIQSGPVCHSRRNINPSHNIESH